MNPPHLAMAARVPAKDESGTDAPAHHRTFAPAPRPTPPKTAHWPALWKTPTYCPTIGTAGELLPDDLQATSERHVPGPTRRTRGGTCKSSAGVQRERRRWSTCSAVYPRFLDLAEVALLEPHAGGLRPSEQQVALHLRVRRRSLQEVYNCPLILRLHHSFRYDSSGRRHQLPPPPIPPPQVENQQSDRQHQVYAAHQNQKPEEPFHRPSPRAAGVTRKHQRDAGVRTQRPQDAVCGVLPCQRLLRTVQVVVQQLAVLFPRELFADIVHD